MLLRLLPAGIWTLGTALLWYTVPDDNALLFARFHCFLATYFCLVFVLCCFHKYPHKKIDAIVGGSMALGVGLVMLFFMTRSLPERAFGRIPSFFSLWIFLTLYLILLVTICNFLYNIPLISRFSSLISGIVGLLSLTSMFYGEILLLIPEWTKITVPCYFYSNPIFVVAAHFPGYDYLRAPFLYKFSPLSTWLGPFTYPQTSYACIYYAIATIFLWLLLACGKWKTIFLVNTDAHQYHAKSASTMET